MMNFAKTCQLRSAVRTPLQSSDKNSVYVRISVTGYPGHFVSVSYYLHRCNAASAETGARGRAVIGMCRIKGATS